MNIKYLHLTSISLLALGMAASSAVLAQGIEVNSAYPASAEQGTLALDVEISGNGFDSSVDVVEFLLPCTKDEEPCIDTGGITVKSFKVRGQKKIIANIDVADTAVIADFDISVRSTSRGRGGKGTTLFRVQLKGTGGGNCDNPRYAAKHPDECGGEPQGDPKTLLITVRFGDELDDLSTCISSTCSETSFTTVGNVVCSSQICDFTGTVTDGPVFGIAPSLFNLLAMTSIRGTQLGPELCYDVFDGIPPVPPDGNNGYSYTETGVTKYPIFEFWLRTPVVATPGNWWADVSAKSTDMEDIVQRYIFKFSGQCDRSEGFCPAVSDDIVEGVYENGFVNAVFGSNTNKRNQPQTCRCTVSSKPGCPATVDMGMLARPAVQLSVEEL